MTVSVTEDRLRAGSDLRLQPYDIIVVPKSAIATANQFVEQYLSKMVPSWLTGTAGFSYATGTSTIKGINR
jgi:cellobiose phosphorylase